MDEGGPRSLVDIPCDVFLSQPVQCQGVVWTFYGLPVVQLALVRRAGLKGLQLAARDVQ